MSWTIDSSGPEIGELKDIIHEADTSKILMFCAFSDQGNTHGKNCMPASCPETIVIGAATGWAYPCTWVDSSQVDYLCPGEHILIDRHAKPGSTPKSGSSIATALAAGLGALLLHLTQLVMPDRYDHLRNHTVMRAALQKMAGPNKYIHVQQHFHFSFQEDVFWSWDASGQEKLRELVSGLVVCSSFLPVSLY